MTARGYSPLARALCLASFALFSAQARAHAPPYATDISWVATPTGESPLIRTNRGLIVGDRAAGTFRLVCNDAFGASLVETVPTAELADGGLLVGTYAGGLLRSNAELCDFHPVGPSEVSPVDIELGADGQARALLLPLDGSDGGLFESDDGAANFRELSLVGAAPTALASAPASPERVYVSTNTTDGNLSIGHVLASADGGRHFTDHVLELDGAELRAFVLAVDAADPERLFVRTQSRDGVTAERLLLSEDAGETFRTVVHAGGPLTLAFGDGDEAWVGAATGLYRSLDRGATFEPVLDNGLTRVSCLAVHAGGLYACALRALEFGVLVSEDAGSTFEWFLRFPEVTARAACPASSAEGSSCAAAFEDWSREQLIPAAGAGASGAAGVSDIPPPQSVAGEGAEGCAVGAPGKRGTELSIPLLLVLWGSRRRTRKPDA